MNCNNMKTLAQYKQRKLEEFRKKSLSHWQYEINEDVINWLSSLISETARVTVEAVKEVFTKDETEIIKQDLDSLLRIGQMQRKVVVSGPIDPKFEAWMKEDIRQDDLRKSIVQKIAADAQSTAAKQFLGEK